MNFDKLDIEPTTSCSYDAIQVYNGPDDKSHLMNEICHSNKPITITGTASSMLVRFKSDSSYEGMGFEGTYSFTASSTILSRFKFILIITILQNVAGL